MRISDSMINTLLTGYLNKGKGSIFALQQQMTSGKRVQKPSDDPGAYETIGRLKDDRSNINQFLKNSAQLQLSLATTDGALQSISDILHRGMELTTSASDGTKSGQERISIGKEVDLLINQLVDIANTKSGGRYLFGGLRTDVAPYQATIVGSQVTAVTYQGNTGVQELEIDKYIAGGSANKVAANVPGSDPTGTMAIFQSTVGDLFDDLIRLRDRLLSGRNPIAGETFTANAATEELTVTETYTTGEAVTLDTTDTLPGLTAGGTLAKGSTYYAIVTGPGLIQLADTYANALLGVALDLSDAGTGTHTVVRNSLGELSDAQEQILSIRAEVGARLERASLNEGLLNQQVGALTDTLQTVEDIDLAKATMDLAQQRTAYEAALRVIATTLRTSLADYI